MCWGVSPDCFESNQEPALKTCRIRGQQSGMFPTQTAIATSPTYQYTYPRSLGLLKL